MTQVRALPCSTAAAEAQIEAALSVLIRLLAEQTARELAATARIAEAPTHDQQAED